jgi:transposase
MGQERISLTEQELRRYKVISHWMESSITGVEAAAKLGLSYRQVLRLKKKISKEGATGVIHKNRGRKPAHALPDSLKTTIREHMTGDKYHNCNDHHLSELLAEHEKIQVSPSTIRRIRIKAALPPKKKRRPPKSHRSRKRRAQEGELVQLDGSPHHWLEDRAEPFSLLAAIDDATGKIVTAVFRPQEDTEGYFQLTEQMARSAGIPMAVYTDRHMIFRSPKDKLTIEQELAGESVPLSQYGQALKELGIEHILAFTPQAKGRVERLFQTLQDRWVIELRLMGVATLEEANKCLPKLIEKHNRMFAVAPSDKESAFIPLEPGQSLELILAYRDSRKFNTGETISYQGKTYAIEQGCKHSIPLKATVEIRTTLEHKLYAYYKGQSYPLIEVEKPRRKTDTKAKKAGSEKKSHKPAAAHPWRQYNRKPRIAQQAQSVEEKAM